MHRCVGWWSLSIGWVLHHEIGFLEAVPIPANDVVDKLWASPLQLVATTGISNTIGGQTSNHEVIVQPHAAVHQTSATPLSVQGDTVSHQSGTPFVQRPTNCTVALFSGQGFQHVGMGKGTVATVPAALDLYKRASAVLGYDLLDVVMTGAQDLSRTDIAQPAILVASLAAVEKYKVDFGSGAVNNLCAALGFSIGEFAALTFAGVLSFEDAVRLTQVRGAAMIEASKMSEQSMITIDGPATLVVETVCREVSDSTGGHVGVANYMSTTFHVISGDARSCTEVETRLKKLSKRTQKLSVSGAFHSPFMLPAAEKLQKELRGVTFNRPWLPLMFNVDGAAHADPAVMQALVEQQIISPVRLSTALFTQLMRGVRSAVEFGPASGVTVMFKRVATEIFGTEVGDSVTISNIL